MRRLLIGALLSAAGVFAAPAAAWAHAELLSSQPGYGDRLPVAPSEVRLEFSAAVDVTGARFSLEGRNGPAKALDRAVPVPSDRRTVAIPLPPRLAGGDYSLAWYLLGDDGHLMAGEVSFSVGAPAPSGGAPAARAAAAVPAPVPAPSPVRPLGPGTLSMPLAVVRFIDDAGLAVLLGGGVFLAAVWADGSAERRARRLLWSALLASAAAALLTFGLTAAGLRGAGPLDALRPSVMATVAGTRLARVLGARAAFLGVGSVALALLSVGGERAVRSAWWRALAGVAGAGVLVTHGLLGHASSEGPAARLAVVVHLAGVSVWFGGLVFLAAVVLPRRRPEEVRVVLPRFSGLAFTAVTAVCVAGAVMMTRVVPRLSTLPRTGYGRVLLVKLGFVALLLLAAQQARTFTERRLVRRSEQLRPLVGAVGLELVLAVLILSSTAVLVGRVPPGTWSTRSPAPPSVTAPKGPPR
jgi:copper transport protein